MDFRAIATLSASSYALPGGQVKAPGNLLVEEDVAHRMEDPGTAADRPTFADVADAPLVGLEDPPQLLDVASGAVGLDDRLRPGSPAGRRRTRISE